MSEIVKWAMIVGAWVWVLGLVMPILAVIGHAIVEAITENPLASLGFAAFFGACALGLLTVLTIRLALVRLGG